MQARLSQRQSLACRECTKSKRKCNKQIPCERCTRLGISCERENVYLRRNLHRHGAEIKYLENLKRELQTSGDIEKTIESIKARIGHLRFGHEKDAQSFTPDKTWPEAPESPHPMVEHPSHTVPGSPDQTVNVTVTALEHMAWGRGYGDCFPHRHCGCQHRRHRVESTSIPQAVDPANVSKMISKLPDQHSAEILVAFHIDHISWHHNTIQCSDFSQQCTVFWETGQYEHLQWIALYCAVLSTSLMCLQNSCKYHEAYPVSLSQYSPLSLFQTMVDVLYTSNFLGDITLHSIQAIVVSTEVAHNLGLSQLNATLFNAAIRMAECIGLHRIGDDSESHLSSSPEEWQDAMEREVGRRVWLQMIIQDHFAIPFTGSYGINPSRYSTSVPKNAENASWMAVTDEIPTTSTYNRVLGKIARLMPEMVDGMGSLKQPRSPQAQHRHVLEIDTKMRDTVRAIPPFLLRQDVDLERQHPWLLIARQSLAITAAEKIIMVHRPFISQSFQSSTYSHTRRTCTAAAITILREHRNITDSGELSLWTHIAFCITAAVILSFEIICSQSTSGQNVLQSYVDLVRGARRQLSLRINDTLAHRGVVLLDAIFAEAGCGEPISDTREVPILTPVRFEDIVVRFTTDLGALGLATQTGPWETPSSETEQSTQGDSLEDFNDWFQATFHSFN